MKEKVRTVYVCAPYRSQDWAGVRNNIGFARACGEELRRLGWTPVVIQALVNDVFGEDTDDIDKEVTAFCLAILSSCDAMCVCGGKVSAGMRADINFCKEHGIPIFCLQGEKHTVQREI